jgi:hypothetical protein
LGSAPFEREFCISGAGVAGPEQPCIVAVICITAVFMDRARGFWRIAGPEKTWDRFLEVIVRKSLMITLVLSVGTISHALADQCDDQAVKFTYQRYLKVSPRLGGNFFLLTDERFPNLSARLVCNGPRGTEVNSKSPPHLEQSWIDMLAELGSVLTRATHVDIAFGIRQCMSNPEPQPWDLIHRIDYQAHDFYISCDPKSDGQIEFGVAKVN